MPCSTNFPRASEFKPYCIVGFSGERLFYRPEKHLIVLLGFDEPDVVRTMFAHKTDEFSKGYSPLAETVLGKGGLALTVDHESWARQRRVVRPVFYASYIKVLYYLFLAWK